MQYKGCTLEYWAKCRSQDDAIAFCRARGSELFSYMDGADLAVFSSFVGRQSSATRMHGVATCAGYGQYYPAIISAIVWTALRSRSGNACGTSCVWQDLRTGNLVTNISGIAPCNMEGYGDAVEFDMRSDCPSGGSNDNMRTATNHFICGADCGGRPFGAFGARLPHRPCSSASCSCTQLAAQVPAAPGAR